MLEDLAGIFAITFSLGIPVIAIICGTISSIKKKQQDKEIRRLIIENNTDLEMAKQLLDEPRKTTNKYTALRWACVLIGLGFGALVDYLVIFDPTDNVYFWFILAFGVGLGLLASFILEFKLQSKKKEQEA